MEIKSTTKSKHCIRFSCVYQYRTFVQI